MIRIKGHRIFLNIDNFTLNTCPSKRCNKLNKSKDCRFIDWVVISDMMPRSGFKASDRVQGQGAGRSRKRSIHWVCEHLSEAVLHPNPKNQMRIPLAGQRDHWTLDGF
jgi:hypothetical protein